FEYVFRLEGLPVPPEPSTADTTYSSMQLFIECAERSGSRDFLTPAYLADAGRICQFVNGLPLGIELTAGWTRWLAPSEIWQTLHTHDGVLALALPELPPRHRSMQAVFEYSWQLLSDTEQKVLAQ